MFVIVGFGHDGLLFRLYWRYELGVDKHFFGKIKRVLDNMPVPVFFWHMFF